MTIATRYRVLSLPMALLVTVGLAAGCDDNGDAPGTADAAPAQQPQPPPDQPALLETQQLLDLADLGFNEGNEDTAVVAVIEFSDFGCIFCANFHEESYPVLAEEFVETGDVWWKYIPITIGGFPNGDQAGLAGDCAGQLGAFAPVRDRLYQEREAWMEAANPVGLLVEFATDAGLDAAEFQACMESEETAERLAENNQMSQEVGVRGTPTFVVQGYPVQGAPPLDNFQDVLRQIVAEARAGEGP